MWRPERFAPCAAGKPPDVNRRRLHLIVAAVLMVAGLLAAFSIWVVRAPDNAAVQAAHRYLDALVDGDERELRELPLILATRHWGLSTTAGYLVDAEERIEVVSVGEPRAVERPAMTYSTDVTRFTEVEVRYRLGETEHTWPLVVAQRTRGVAWDADDWLVVNPMLGSVDWGDVTFASRAVDAYVGGVSQFPEWRREGEVQYLHPAVYRVERRVDSWFASGPRLLAVPAGDPVAAPEQELSATPKAEEWLQGRVESDFSRCEYRPGYPRPKVHQCPAADIARAHQIEPVPDGSWWGGLVTVPTVTIDGTSVTVTGGSFELRGPDGDHQVPFAGTGRVAFDDEARFLDLAAFTIEEES